MESEEREPLMILNQTGDGDEDTIESTRTATVQPSSSAKTKLLKVIFVVGSLVSNVGMYATTPIYTSIMTDVSDIYGSLIMTGFATALILALSWIVQQCVILRERVYFISKTSWKILILCGFLSSVQNVVVVYAALPTRTPSYLYPLLSPAIIPITAFARYLILRKGLSMRQVLCCGVVIMGIFISAIPTIFRLKVRDDDNDHEKDDPSPSSSSSFIWPALMLLGQIPAAVNYVLYESSAQRRTKELLLFYFWTQLIGFVWLILLFWTDVIPGFGQATSVNDFLSKMKTAFECHFGIREDSLRGCDKVPTIFILNTFSYVGCDVFLISLMAVSEGSVFSTLISSLSLPLSAFFWILFRFEEKILSLVWDPIINYYALLPLAGLLMLIPSTVYYDMSAPT